MHRTLIASVLLLNSLAAQAQQTIGTWTAVTTATSPADRNQAQLVYDPVRDVMFLAGGSIPPQADQVSEFWEFNCTNWAQRVPATVLNLRTRPTRFVFCPPRGRVLALNSASTFGGSPMALYEWNGSNWLAIASNAPTSRADYFDIAWDSSRSVLVMFGGGNSYADTWEWDGTNWTQRGTGGPPGRYAHRMVYDAARQRVVLYGGIGYQNSYGYTDTWEWDGVSWQERFGIPSPGVSDRFGLTYDTVRQRCLTFGGNLVATSGYTNQVSLYDGTAWSVLTSFGAPSSIWGAAIAYDTLRNRVLSFGGRMANTQIGTMSLSVRTGIVAGFAPHGAGCAGPAGIPNVTARNGTRPMLGGTLQLRFGNLANSPLALVFATIGFEDQNWSTQPLPLDLTGVGMPGCHLRIAPAVTEVLSNNGGLADWNIAVPANPALDGLRFFVQGAVLAPGFNAAGAVLSDSAQGTAGAL